MKNPFKDKQTVALIIGGVAAAVITAWIFNPQSGPAGLIKGLSPSTQALLSGIMIALVLACVGLMLTLFAARYARTGALQPAHTGGLSDVIRMLFAPQRKVPATPPNKAIEDLEAVSYTH